MLSQNMCWRCDNSEISEEDMTKCSVCRLAKYCSMKCFQADKYRHKVDCENASARYHCHGCQKTGSEMKQCTNCLMAWFCSKECMKQSWKLHKTKCLLVNERTVEVCKLMEPAKLCRLQPVLRTVYYWGNTPAVDLINLPMNEGSDFSGSLKLLLCGVADPRSVCLTLALLPESYSGHLTFVLNDLCICAMARVVLLLYLTIKGGSEKATSITQIWYSLFLTDYDHTFLVSALQDLTRISNLEVLTHGIMQVSADHLCRLKAVWTGWLSLSNRFIGIEQQRQNVLDGHEHQMKLYWDEIPPKFKKSAQEWFQNGVLLSGKLAKNLTRENVSLTGFNSSLSENAEDLRYCVIDDALPFSCWDYKAAIKALPESDSLQQVYSAYIKSVIQATARRLEKSEAVKIVCILGDCIDLPRELPAGLQFDRITTSNLWDYIPLLRILKMAKTLLNKTNPSAVILTETKNWVVFFPRIFEKDVFLQTGLCLFGFPLSQIRHSALKDSGAQIAFSQGIVGFIEYYNFVEHFLAYLRASLFPPSKPLPKFMPSLKSLAGDQGLILRDPTQLENRIVPFRYAINCRRPTMMSGTTLTVEWVLKK